MPTAPPKKGGFIRFITSTVVILIAVGVILIIFGVTGFITNFFPAWGEISKASINNILRTTGAAVLGGGVLSSLVQSNRFTEIFQKIFEDVLWSNDFLKRRGDIREVWNNVSRLLYQDKFPLLSNDIEEIITTEYFPTNHDFYIENYDLTITLKEKNEHYLEHIEYLTVTLRPAKGATNLSYKFGMLTAIPPPQIGVLDETNLEVEQLILNGQAVQPNNYSLTKDKTETQHQFKFNLPLDDADEHNIIIKRKKTLNRDLNKDKRFFASYFQKDVKVTVIAPIGLSIAFYPMGTTKEFIKASEQVNEGLRILKYYYNGLILPKQGFFILVG